MNLSKNSFELIVGSLVLLVAISFCIKIFSSSGVKKTSTNGIVIFADFSNSEGIDAGSDVKIAGVKIGVVMEKTLSDTYKSKVKIGINKGIQIPIDSNAAVVSSGLLGGKYIEIRVGIEDTYMIENSKFQSTQSSVNLEELIGKFAFNGK